MAQVVWPICYSENREEKRSFSAPLVDPQLFRQLIPLTVHHRLSFLVHQDLVWPGAGEAFAFPLAGSVDAHFRAEVRKPGSMIERINRTKGELNVALRIDVVQ